MFRSRAVIQLEAHMSWQFTKIESWLGGRLKGFQAVDDLFMLIDEPALESFEKLTVGDFYNAMDRRLVKFGIEMNEIGADAAALVIDGKTASRLVLGAMWEAAPNIKTTKQVGDMMPIVEAMVDELKSLVLFKDGPVNTLEDQFVDNYKMSARMQASQQGKLDGFDDNLVVSKARKTYVKAKELYSSLPYEFRQVMEFMHACRAGCRFTKTMLERQDKYSIDTMKKMTGQ